MKKVVFLLIYVILISFLGCQFVSADSGISGNGWIALKDVIPLAFQGMNADIFIPPGPTDVKSNAIESYSADYKKDGINLATVFAVKTEKELYNHQLQICSRCHGSTLETCSQVGVENAAKGMKETSWYWYSCYINGETLSEAITFTAFVNERTRTVSIDSHWLAEDYAIPECDAVFNFQIWSSDPVFSVNMLKQVLERFHSLKGWELQFLNTSQQPAPSVYFKNAVFTSEGIVMQIQSWLEKECLVDFRGSFRKPWDKVKTYPFDRKVNIKPGMNTVKVALDSVLLDVSIHIENNGFRDILYAANSCTWSSFGNENSEIEMQLTEDENKPRPKDSFYLWGNLKLTGKIGKNGWCGVFKSLNANSLPTDVSKYKYLNFYARGSGTYRVNLESGFLRDKGDYDFHQSQFRAESKGKAHKMSLSAFRQKWSDKIPYTGKDIVSIAFVAEYPTESVDLEISEIYFSKD